MGKGAGNICFKSKSTELVEGEAHGLTATSPQYSNAEEASVPLLSNSPSAASSALKQAADPVSPVASIPNEAEPVPTSPTAQEPAAASPNAPVSELISLADTKRKTKIFVIFYTTYGHLYSVAKEIKKGIDSVEGCEAELYQVAETLAPRVLEKMRAPPKPDVPVITAEKLVEADGFAFGFGTRFGAMPAQVKAFFDSTGQLWQKGSLVGKPATFFTSTTTPAGGADLTIFTGLTQVVPHGMIFVPVGYSYGPAMFDTTNVDGGSPWGAATLTTHQGTRQPSEKEIGLSRHQGALFAKVARKLHD